jgi:hypothetical protein
MGQFSKVISEKSNEELREILKSISNYQGEFIDDFLNELDNRNLLEGFKVLINNSDLITIVVKIEKIQESKYLKFIQRELIIRGLINELEKRKRNDKIAHEKTSKNWMFNIFGFLLIVGFFIFYNRNKLFKNNSQVTNNKIDFDSKSFQNINKQTNLPKIKVPDVEIDFPKKDVSSYEYGYKNDNGESLLKDSQTREILQKIRNSR